MAWMGGRCCGRLNRREQTDCSKNLIVRLRRSTRRRRICKARKATFSSSIRRPEVDDSWFSYNDMRCSSARAVHGQIGQVVSRYVSNSIQRRFTSSTSPIGRSATSLTSKTPGLCRGRRVLLTGGTSGIGLSVAHRLRQEGAELCVLAVRDEDRGQKARNIVLRSGVTGFEQGSAEGREDVSMDVRLLVINDLTDSRLLRKEVTNAMREWVSESA